jgi:nucleotide-binding universal stress UspA family protein
MTGTLDVDLVLVPVDGSEESLEAVEYAVAVAERYDASVHAVYVFGGETVQAIEAGAVDEDEVAVETESFLDTVAELSAAADVGFTRSTAYGFSTRVKLRHPGSVILDTAEELDADFLVVPRESVTDDHSDVLEKAAEYVLLYASQPVLSV